MRRQIILVVDDDPSWLKLLCRLFTGNDYEIVAAMSCSGAIEAAKIIRPDCVVLDYNLPDGNAGTVCSGLGARAGRRIPVVVFSSDPAAGSCLAGEFPADKLLLKNAALETLLAAVKELLAPGTADAPPPGA